MVKQVLRWPEGKLPLAMRFGNPPEVLAPDGSEPEKLSCWILPVGRVDRVAGDALRLPSLAHRLISFMPGLQHGSGYQAITSLVASAVVF